MMPGRQQKIKRNHRSSKSNLEYLAQYAGLGVQLLVAIGLALWLGIKADEWLTINTAIFSWLLPLLIVIVMIIKIVKETGRR